MCDPGDDDGSMDPDPLVDSAVEGMAAAGVGPAAEPVAGPRP